MEVNHIHIRNYRPEDHNALALIYLQSRVKTFYWLNAREYTLADFDTHTEGEKILVAEQGGEPVGFVAIWEPDNFIHHLYIRPDVVRKGAGKALLNAAAAIIDAPLKLKCLLKNENALAFYQSQNWVITGDGTDANGPYFEMASKFPGV